MQRVCAWPVLALLVGGLLAAGCAPDDGDGWQDPTKNPAIDDLLQRMTLEQKLLLASGVGADFMLAGSEQDQVPGAAGYTHPFAALGLPATTLADGPAGLRIHPTREGDDATYYATAFPIATALAASWDLQLAEAVGKAMGTEALEYGVDLFLAPGLNIHRDPRGGRNFEYYSEDPLLSGRLAAALIKGVQRQGVGATPKHYAANNQETSRNSLDTVVSERALREIYLRGFEIAVREARPWAIMSAYNKVNGIEASQHRQLLTTVLRHEWGFDGVVMSDWFAGMEDAPAQLRAGNELLMPGTEQGAKQLKAALASGALDEAVLDRNLRYLLGMVLKTPAYKQYPFSNQPDLKGHAQVARAAAAEGAVLLKNSGVLPLGREVKRLAVFGNTSYDFISGGTGSGDVNEAYTVSLMEALESHGYRLNAGLKARYLAYMEAEKAKIPPKQSFWEQDVLPPEMPLPRGLAAAQAETADLALITLGRTSGEFQDRPEEDFHLSDAEQSLVSAVSRAFRAAGKPVALVLNIGNVVEVASWRDQVDAILLPWQGGQEAGHAVVDLLTGAVNPSGKLPMTFPRVYEDAPAAANFPGVALAKEPIVIGDFIHVIPMRVEYQEGIYVGYRHYDAFAVPPAYEFGYGLSYTQFAYADLQLSAKSFNGSLKASIKITNTGQRPGKEVAQLYLAAPQTALRKPERELKGFAKTRLLAPGESQTLEFTLEPKALASFHEAKAAWVAEPGSYTVIIGASSRDLKATASFVLDNELLVEKSMARLAPTRPLAERVPPPVSASEP